MDNLHASPTWKSWRNMKRRCKSPDKNFAKYYRDRGIDVCERWKLSHFPIEVALTMPIQRDKQHFRERERVEAELVQMGRTL
jgi:hypothetical protein